MPTATGRETADERDTRQRAETFAAIRSAITPDMLRDISIILDNVRPSADDPGHQQAIEGIEFTAGDRLTLKAGRRSIEVDEGEVWRLALSDALKLRGFTVIAHGTSFGIGAGRSSIKYTVTVA